MARFVPPRGVTDPHSSAEGRVLAWLERLDDSWIVLHSVGLTQHETKPWAEADVVLISARGLLVLEVKGGRIERRHGLWGFRDRFERVTWKAEGPWGQAGGAAAALRRHLIRHGDLQADVAVHYGVLLPDCALQESGPDVLREVTLDASRAWGDPQAELLRILDYWRDRVPSSGVLDATAQMLVAQRIRGDLALTVLPSITASRVREHQARLTDDQAALIRATQENDRLLIAGSAGTGKSSLAVSIARELGKDGDRVALLVHNVALARRLRSALGDTNVDVRTIDSLARRVVPPRADEPPLTTEADWEELRHRAVGAVTNPMYDAVVVDEGQDFDEAGAALVDATLEGGLGSGRWRVFLDPDQDVFDREGAEVWQEFEATRLRLSRNCRSTKQIAASTSILSGRLLDIRTPVDGPEVEHRWYSGGIEVAEMLRQVVAQRLSDYGADAVLVVTPGGLSSHERDSLASLAPGRPFNDVRDSDDGPFVGTGSSVKGLESVSVVVHGVRQLRSTEARRFLYTACSRATVDLAVLLPEAVKEDYAAGAAWFGVQLSQALNL